MKTRVQLWRRDKCETETSQIGDIFFCADWNEPQASCIVCLQNFHLAKLPSLRNRSCSSFSDVGVVFLSSHPLSCVFSLLKWSPVCFPCWNGLLCVFLAEMVSRLAPCWHFFCARLASPQGMRASKSTCLFGRAPSASKNVLKWAGNRNLGQIYEIKRWWIFSPECVCLN